MGAATKASRSAINKSRAGYRRAARTNSNVRTGATGDRLTANVIYAAIRIRGAKNRLVRRSLSNLGAAIAAAGRGVSGDSGAIAGERGAATALRVLGFSAIQNFRMGSKSTAAEIARSVKLKISKMATSMHATAKMAASIASVRIFGLRRFPTNIAAILGLALCFSRAFRRRINAKAAGLNRSASAKIGGVFAAL